MDPDALFELVNADGNIAKWRVGDRAESGALATRVAAHQYRQLCTLLDRELAGGPATVLDWGCGLGAFGYSVAAQGHTVYATDLQVPPMAPELERRSEGRFHFVRIEHPTELPFESGQFDVVLSNGCLEHVRETGGSDDDSMLEVARVLKPGGRFVCCHLPNEGSYIEAVARGLRKPSRRLGIYPLYAHNFLYTKDRILELASHSGLEVTDVHLYGAFPRNPLSLLPNALANAQWFVSFADRTDDALSRRFAPRCQNFYWVARKPG